ncbi:arginase [Clostridium algidicarnis]|uniref:Arginase n=1 Tax=Clostridium algidicarnis DSM 15099 TaxID=1121295 RepID=A0A2S6FZK8_9CLOT|nr:arginase [Clostridium algidicarnis]PPK49067.1 arginase [Clostridium algidicarnis DSM 15099]
MKINLIGVPIFYGCDNKGVEFGPDILRENGIDNIAKKYGHELCDLGNIIVPKVDESHKYVAHKTMKYLDTVTKVNEDLANEVYNSLNSGVFPFIVGGDHSLGLGSVSGASKYLDDISVIWVDAHGDINTDTTSPSGNVHGMPLSAAMGIGHENLTNVFYKGRKVNPKNVYIIGARDLDKGERDLISKLGLNVWSTEHIKKNGIESVINELIEILSNNGSKNIHLSFDIDALDSKLVPGTGTPVSNGLSIVEVKYILMSILDTKNVKSMDFVELNPKIDKDNKTLELSLEMIDLIFSHI